MKPFSFRLSLSTPFIAAVLALLSLSAIASPAEAQASHRIEAYYNQLMPTLRAAGQLSVRERDRRFSPAITSAFDIGTMAKLASGPAWSKFSGAQQAAVRDAFARFLVAEYAHQVGDYSGESFVVDPQTSPSSGGGEVVKTKLLQPGGRTVQINYLVRGGRVIADWPGLGRGALLDDRDLRPTLDLRSVFKAVLDEHMHVDARTLSTRVFPDSSGARPLQGLMRA